jgi:hypothetical protein
MQVIGNDGHEEIGGIAVEKHKAKGDGQDPDQPGFILHPRGTSGIYAGQQVLVLYG